MVAQNPSDAEPWFIPSKHPLPKNVGFDNLNPNNVHLTRDTPRPRLLRFQPLLQNLWSLPSNDFSLHRRDRGHLVHFRHLPNVQHRVLPGKSRFVDNQQEKRQNALLERIFFD